MTKRAVEHLPVEPIRERGVWTKRLTAISRRPLEFRPDFPAVAKRHEAWWHQDVVDRPPFLAEVVIDPSVPSGKFLDLLARPDEWLARWTAQMENRRCIGDALPNVRVEFGPVFMGEMFGAKVDFVSDTTWTHAFIDDDWSNAPDWVIDEGSFFWKQFVTLTHLVAREARGKYLLRTPDFGGSGDVLLNLRGAEGLCMDVMERPEVVRAAADAIYDPWRKAFTEAYRMTLCEGAGLIHWIGMWSDEPYMIPACDFNYLIGPREFNRCFLPDIARQAATAGRAVFHLDGPGATRHIDALLEIPEMTAIQYVTGAGTPSALPWLDMFRKIQAKGRSIVLQCPPDEVMTVLDALEPEGLMFTPCTGDGWDRIDDVFAALCKRFGCEG